MKKIKMGDLEYLEQAVLNLLKVSTGEGAYMSSTKIINNIPLIRNGRNVRKVINTLRQQNEPIISNSRGYRYTNDLTDLYIYSESLRLRMLEMKKGYDGLMAYYDKQKELIVDEKEDR